MRRTALVFILTVITAVLLTSCKSLKDAVTAKKPDLNRAFSCEYRISAFDDLEVTGTMSRCGTNIWEMDIASPESMAGLHISFSDNGANVAFGELGLEILPEKINDGAVFKLIFNAVDNFASLPGAELSETENGYEYSGELPQCGYIMTFDKESCELTGISFPDQNITAEIIMSDEKAPEASSTEAPETGTTKK